MKQHVFFDLDHTLWDFERNSTEALHELFNEYNLNRELYCTFDEFHSTYHQINGRYWDLYKQGKVTREALRNGRFIDTIKQFSEDKTDLGNLIGDMYVKRSPYKKNLFKGTTEILSYLTNKGYQLHIITNGFNEVQYIKMEQSNIKHFFTTITTSENAGKNKPDKHIFDSALKEAKAQKINSIMIGDNFEADIEGAINYGMDAIWFNPDNISVETTYSIIEIKALLDLKQYL